MIRTDNNQKYPWAAVIPWSELTKDTPIAFTIEFEVAQIIVASPGINVPCAVDYAIGAKPLVWQAFAINDKGVYAPPGYVTIQGD